MEIRIDVNGQNRKHAIALDRADHTYRVLVERMNEGAAILSIDHTILLCNQRFARFLGAPRQSIVGSRMLDLVWSDDHLRLHSMLKGAVLESCRGEIRLQSRRGTPLPVQLSLNPVRMGRMRAVCMIASDLSETKRSEQELRASTEQLRNLAEHLLSVREEERASMSRQVHDELGQLLTAMKIDLIWLEKRLPPGNGEVSERIRSTQLVADALIQSVRRISTDLRPAVLDLGLAAAVEWQMQDFQARSGIRCKVRLLAPQQVASDASTAMFRIFQEILTNVARHAEATRVEVVLQTQGNRLVLLVRDNGRGFDPAVPSVSKSLGLLGMRERSAMLGGQVTISSTPRKGTTVKAWIPLPSPEELSLKPAAIA